MNPFIASIRSFFSSSFNRYLIAFLLVLGVVAFFFAPGESHTAELSATEGLTVHFFYLPTCPHCAEQEPIIDDLESELPAVHFVRHDASSPEGSALFYQLSSEAGIERSDMGVPALFIGSKALIGVHSKDQIMVAIALHDANGSEDPVAYEQDSPESLDEYDLPFLGKTDLTAYSLPLLAIVLGLIDGFNPCAMWVLVYLIGLLIGLNDRKRIWIIVGSFVFASGVLYFLFMAAWINVFLLVGYIRVLTLIIGLVALGGGIISLKEYITTKGELACEVGDAQSHKRTMEKVRNLVTQPLSVAIILSIVALAFVVNSVEFVCSAAIPAVFTQVLALKGLSAIQNYGYIALYTLFFMLDDLIIFGMAALAINSDFGQRYAKYCRLAGGAILVILGLIMIFAPQLLR